ncbi:MAG: hypothetical protein LUE17_01200 [Planctomycetaceae bacterium]|nr:hypothetical protein [Planctomycetaceae bacterium]
MSSGCVAVRDALVAGLEAAGLATEARIVTTGCMGLCAVGPVLLVRPGDIFYTAMTPEKVTDVVQRHLVGGEVVEEYTYYDPRREDYVPKLSDIDFFSAQVKIALRNCGAMDYASLDAYIARDGYQAFARALTAPPQAVVDVVKSSGLRGRGGAGFPAGVKWQAAHDQQADRKYIVCNADEGDPGAFMDRSIIEGDLHSVIEGMLLGGYAIGSTKGYAYVRAEYPMAIERLQAAIVQARGRGCLGRISSGPASTSTWRFASGRARLFAARKHRSWRLLKGGAANRARSLPSPSSAASMASRPSLITWRPSQTSRPSS